MHSHCQDLWEPESSPDFVTLAVPKSISICTGTFLAFLQSTHTSAFGPYSAAHVLWYSTLLTATLHPYLHKSVLCAVMWHELARFGVIAAVFLRVTSSGLLNLQREGIRFVRNVGHWKYSPSRTASYRRKPESSRYGFDLYLRERDCLDDPDVYGEIILKRVLVFLNPTFNAPPFIHQY
jgi:hypothetical protein